MIKYLSTWAKTNKRHAANDGVPAAALVILLTLAIIAFIIAANLVAKENCPTRYDSEGYCVFGEGWGN